MAWTNESEPSIRAQVSSETAYAVELTEDDSAIAMSFVATLSGCVMPTSCLSRTARTWISAANTKATLL